MRSPIAAGLMRREVGGRQDIKIESAGLFAGAGRPADPTAIIAARGVHLDLGDHRSAVLTPEMVNEADVILVMDLLNEATLRARFHGVSSKILRLSDYTSNPGPELTEIVDPYGQGLAAAEACCGQIQQCVRNIARLIQRKPHSDSEIVVLHASDDNWEFRPRVEREFNLPQLSLERSRNVIVEDLVAKSTPPLLHWDEPFPPWNPGLAPEEESAQGQVYQDCEVGSSTSEEDIAHGQNKDSSES